MLENAYSVRVKVRGTTHMEQKKPWNIKEQLLGTAKTKKAGAAADMFDGRSIYRDEEGYCCIPFHHIRGSLKNASSWVKLKGNSSCKTPAKALIWTGTPEKPEAMIRIIGANTGKWVKDEDEIAENIFPDKQGKMHYVERPMWRIGWEAEFTLTCLDGNFINPDKLYQILETAGMMFGWGAHRPDNGRFVILIFELIANPKNEAAAANGTKRRGRPKKNAD